MVGVIKESKTGHGCISETRDSRSMNDDMLTFCHSNSSC